MSITKMFLMKISAQRRLENHDLLY